LRLGFHVSIAGSIDRAVDRAAEMGCNTFQIFTRNPRGWRFKALDQGEAERFARRVGERGIEPVFGHMPYLPNLASPREEVYEKSVESLTAELGRCARLGIPYLVTHLGSHLGAGPAVGLRRIVEAVNRSFSEAGGAAMLLLENTAGARNSVGSTFEDLRYIVERVENSDRVGVCFDTCHGFAAGYDLRTPGAVEGTVREIGESLGLDRLRLVHLNDSKGDLGSGVDRHEHIGMGRIGEEGFRGILRSGLGRLPLILETPVDRRRRDVENLEKVRELARQPPDSVLGPA